MASRNGEPVSVGQWMWTMLAVGIPIIGFILLVYWALSSETPPSKSNWAKATLIWMVIGMVLGFLIFVVFGLGAALLASAV